MIVLIDFETTGLMLPEASPLKEQPKVIEIGAIKTDLKFKEIDRLSILINPNEIISDQIIKITGITNEMLKKEKPFPFYYFQLCDFFLGVKYFIAHNLPFDSGMMKLELIRMGKEFEFPWPFNWICTAETTRHLNSDGNRFKLVQLYKYLFGKEFKQKHRAISDVEYLLKCVKELKKRGEIEL